MAPITIRIAGEPRGKGRPRFARATGRTFTPETTRRFEAHLKLAAEQAMGARPLMEGPLRISVRAAFLVPESWSKRKREQARTGAIRPTKAPDADNILKTVDAFNGVVFRDDAQIVEATVEKVYSPTDTPELVITVEPIGATA